MRDVRSPSPGDLAITEWMANPSVVSDSDGEWFEVIAFSEFDLNGLVISNGGTQSSTLSSTQCLAANAGAYLVFGRNPDPSQNGGLPTLAGTFNFNLVNSNGQLSLALPDGGLLDSVSYASASSGASSYVGLSQCDPVQNDVAANICLTPSGTVYGAAPDGGSGDRGTPGSANTGCP